MCLYQLKLRNPHYQINEQNKGNVPTPKDVRHLNINTNCGWCIECRRELANEWRIRLQEEWKANKNVQFVTLSFSPEGIKKLSEEIITKSYKGLGKGEIDVNILAAYAIRMWSERWRKKYKKAPRRWFITELGHRGSERIHLHGLIWNEENESNETTIKAIEETWGYGNIYCGQYVNERTFTYITKYVTKLDEFHKGYKQKIFTSKGMGLSYLNRGGKRIHQFRGDKTITYYTNHQNFKFKLPRYYKQKLWTKEEREYLWTKALDEKKQRILGVKYDMNKITVQEFAKALKGARESNERAGFGDNTTVNKKYVVTEAMTMNYAQLMNLDKTKLVTSVPRRLTEKISYFAEKNKNQQWIEGKPQEPEYRDNIDIDKSLDINRYILGFYVGNTTEAERKYNEELRQANEEKLTVRRWRLKQKGLPY